MQARIVITLDGQVTLITRAGTFEAGRERIEALLAELAAGGLQVSLDRPVEQHRHADAGRIQVPVEAHE